MLKNSEPIHPKARKVLLDYVMADKFGGVQEITEYHYRYITHFYDRFAKDNGRFESAMAFCEKHGFPRVMWNHVTKTYYGSGTFFRQVLKWALAAEMYQGPDPTDEPETVGDPNNPEWE